MNSLNLRLISEEVSWPYYIFLKRLVIKEIKVVSLHRDKFLKTIMVGIPNDGCISSRIFRNRVDCQTVGSVELALCIV